MTNAATPGQALALLRALSCDVVAAAVVGADGAVLAGEPPSGPMTIRASAGGLELVAALGPHAMPALARHDAEAALAWISRPAEGS